MLEVRYLENYQPATPESCGSCRKGQNSAGTCMAIHTIQGLITVCSDSMQVVAINTEALQEVDWHDMALNAHDPRSIKDNTKYEHFCGNPSRVTCHSGSSSGHC